MDLGPGVRVFVGANAQGKTNLLEAVHVIATGSSHRVSTTAPLVRAGQSAAVIRTFARTGGGSHRLRVELELRPGGKSRARLGGQERSRARDVIGSVRCVLFSPEDLSLVRGDPSDRRRFLDDVLAMRRPAYAAARAEYDRVLRQRNALLKDARRRGGAPDATLDDWTAVLVRSGATLLAARIAAVHALSGPTQDAYGDLVVDRREQPFADQIAAEVGTRISDGDAYAAGHRVGLRYDLSTGRSIVGDSEAGIPDPVVLADELRDGLAELAPDERDRGITLAGPHRDELTLSIGDLEARNYASHGECWSLALALRLASREVLHEVGDEPIVMLDDVFAELDEYRRERLAQRCETFEQVLVTAAVDADVPLTGPRYHVRSGTVATTPSAGAA